MSTTDLCVYECPICASPIRNALIPLPHPRRSVPYAQRDKFTETNEGLGIGERAKYIGPKTIYRVTGPVHPTLKEWVVIYRAPAEQLALRTSPKDLERLRYLGAIYDSAAKMWRVPEGADLASFVDFFPPGDTNIHYALARRAAAAAAGGGGGSDSGGGGGSGGECGGVGKS